MIVRVLREFVLRPTAAGTCLHSLNGSDTTASRQRPCAASDGYATGSCGLRSPPSWYPSVRPIFLRRGVAWLQSNQRLASGRWFTRSLSTDGHHYITHAGTAFAVLALGELARLRDQTAGNERAKRNRCRARDHSSSRLASHQSRPATQIPCSIPPCLMRLRICEAGTSSTVNSSFGFGPRARRNSLALRMTIVEIR